QQRPRDDRGGARDLSGKSRDDEDARSEERTDVDGDRVAERDHTAQGRRGSRAAFLDRLQGGGHRGRFIEFLFITLPLGPTKTEVLVFGCTDRKGIDCLERAPWPPPCSCRSTASSNRPRSGASHSGARRPRRLSSTRPSPRTRSSWDV